MKIRSSLTRFLLLLTLGFLPSLCLGSDTDGNRNAVQTLPLQTEKITVQNMVYPNMVNPESMTGKVSFKIYYGFPYEYSPYYHSYYMPYHCCCHYSAAAGS